MRKEQITLKGKPATLITADIAKCIIDADGRHWFSKDYSDEGLIFKDDKAFERYKDEPCYVAEAYYDDCEESIDYLHEVFYPVTEWESYNNIKAKCYNALADLFDLDEDMSDEEMDKIFPICFDEDNDKSVRWENIDAMMRNVFGNLEWQCVDTEIMELINSDEMICQDIK